MQPSQREKLMEKNQRLIDMVIERAKRDFPEDIALIGLTGSIATGDFHEKSDLDLIIVNETDRGWKIATAFILDDVGYDIYCTPWSPRIEAQSTLESPMAGCLLDLQVLYSAKPESLDRLKAYQDRARAILSEPIGRPAIERAEKSLAVAKRCYADAVLADGIGEVRYHAGGVLYEVVNALTHLNNTYINRGIRRYLEILRAYQYLPEQFEALYFKVIRAKTVEALRESALNLLRATLELKRKMADEFIEKPAPTYENLWGTYEELWCNCRNKVISSTDQNDLSYAFHAALGAQNYLDEMTQMCGAPRFDLMRHFDHRDLKRFQAEFLRAMDEYAKVYDAVGRKIERYDSIDALYDDFINGRLHQ